MTGDFFEHKEWKRMIQFVLAVYRVTALFPPGEVLTEKLRESACDLAQIFALAAPTPRKIMDTPKTRNDFLFRLRAFQSLFIIAREEAYVKRVNFDVLINELDYFEKLILPDVKKRGFFSKRKTDDPPPSSSPLKKIASKKKIKPEGESARPRRDTEGKRQLILEALQKQPLKIAEIKSLFPAVITRTVRRHLEYLCLTGMVIAEGEGKQRIYRIKKQHL